MCDKSKDLCIGGLGAGKDLAQGAHKPINVLPSELAKLALQTILYQTHCKILRVPPLFFSFLDSLSFLAAPLLPE